MLERSNKSNLLISACRIYLDYDHVRTTLADFTYCVAMPFQNCVERCDQNQLVEILAKLHREAPCLKPYYVHWTHVNMEKESPTSDLDTFILNEMCINVAKGNHLQCSREYLDTQLSIAEERATSILQLTENERQNLPTEILKIAMWHERNGTMKLYLGFYLDDNNFELTIWRLLKIKLGDKYEATVNGNDRCKTILNILKKIRLYHVNRLVIGYTM